jgi:hypothetical protein
MNSQLDRRVLDSMIRENENENENENEKKEVKTDK